MGERQEQEQRDDRSARDIEPRQDIFLAQHVARAAKDIGAEDIEKPDQRQHLRADPDPQPLVVEIGG